jgi:shikimate dehydrogenase
MVMLSGKGKVAAIIGWPVAHSLSPALHTFWLNYYNIDGAYIPMPVKPEELGEVIRILPKLGIRGFNLTLPHKELVIPFLDYMDEDAKAIGAVNTVLIANDGTIQGMNTDAYGFIRNIQPHIDGKKNKAVVLGAGGAAKAICYGLIKEGYNEILLLNRTQEKAEEMASHFGAHVHVLPWEQRARALDWADLLVNATSLGMEGKEPLDINLDMLPKHAVVTDIVYTPLQTPLLKDAKGRGYLVVDGLGMLIHQAVPGFRAWFGMKPEVMPELRPHLLKALG